MHYDMLCLMLILRILVSGFRNAHRKMHYALKTASCGGLFMGYFLLHSTKTKVKWEIKNEYCMSQIFKM